MINGQTGEVQGERTWSWGKFAVVVVAVLVVVAIVVVLSEEGGRMTYMCKDSCLCKQVTY